MSKIALITDLHYGVRADNQNFFEYFRRFNMKFFQYIKENQIRHVVILGDLFDHRTFINLYTLYRCGHDFLKPLSALGVSVHVLAGNHDIYYKNTLQVNSLEPLLEAYNFDIILEPKERSFFGKKTLMVPWIASENKDLCETAIKTSDAKICFGHFEIEGLGEGTDRSIGVDPSIFKKFDLVLSGHYHPPSVRDNVRYIGAAYQHTWSDYGSDRGFSILDMNTLSVEMIKNEDSMFRMVVYDDKDKKEFIENLVNSGDFSEYSTKYVQIVVLNRQNTTLFEQFCQGIEKVGPTNINYIEGELISAIQNEKTEDLVIEDTVTTLNKYVDDSRTSLNKEKLKKLLQSVYVSAIKLERSFGSE